MGTLEVNEFEVENFWTMLSSASRASSRLSVKSCISKRTFFDYIKVASEVDAGKSIPEIKSALTASEDTKQADSFGWQWLSWFQDNIPEKYADYASIRSQFQRWEQYLGSKAVSSSKSIDFADYRIRLRIHILSTSRRLITMWNRTRCRRSHRCKH